MSEWKLGKSCNATCKKAGTETWWRKETSPAQHGGKCGETVETRPCGPKLCPVGVVTVSGRVKNAVDQSPVEGAKVQYDDHTVTTDGKGGFELDVNVLGDEPEKVTLTVTKEGFIDEEHTEEITSNRKPEEEVVVEMSPKLEPGQLRFVMVWGPQPNDLDAITKFGPGGENCKVDYNAKTKKKTCENGVSGILDWDHCWYWDGEDKGSCPDPSKETEPETTTISAAECSGECKISYKVNNYSGEQHPQKDKGTLEESKAVVKVYSGNKAVATFRAGEHGKIDGHYWYVFSVDVKKGTKPEITECTSESQCGF